MIRGKVEALQAIDDRRPEQFRELHQQWHSSFGPCIPIGNQHREFRLHQRFRKFPDRPEIGNREVHGRQFWNAQVRSAFQGHFLKAAIGSPAQF